MTDKEYYIEQLRENITLPKEIAEIQVAYIEKFGLNSKEDLYDIETELSIQQKQIDLLKSKFSII